MFRFWRNNILDAKTSPRITTIQQPNLFHNEVKFSASTIEPILLSSFPDSKQMGMPLNYHELLVYIDSPLRSKCLQATLDNIPILASLFKEIAFGTLNREISIEIIDWPWRLKLQAMLNQCCITLDWLSTNQIIELFWSLIVIYTEKNLFGIDTKVFGKACANMLNTLNLRALSPLQLYNLLGEACVLEKVEGAEFLSTLILLLDIVSKLNPKMYYDEAVVDGILTNLIQLSNFSISQTYEEVKLLTVFDKKESILGDREIFYLEKQHKAWEKCLPIILNITQRLARSEIISSKTLIFVIHLLTLLLQRQGLLITKENNISFWEPLLKAISEIFNTLQAPVDETQVSKTQLHFMKYMINKYSKIASHINQEVHEFASLIQVTGEFVAAINEVQKKTSKHQVILSPLLIRSLIHIANALPANHYATAFAEQGLHKLMALNYITIIEKEVKNQTDHKKQNKKHQKSGPDTHVKKNHSKPKLATPEIEENPPVSSNSTFSGIQERAIVEVRTNKNSAFNLEHFKALTQEGLTSTDFLKELTGAMQESSEKISTNLQLPIYLPADTAISIPFLKKSSRTESNELSLSTSLRSLPAITSYNRDEPTVFSKPPKISSKTFDSLQLPSIENNIILSEKITIYPVPADKSLSVDTLEFKKLKYEKRNSISHFEEPQSINITDLDLPVIEDVKKDKPKVNTITPQDIQTLSNTKDPNELKRLKKKSKKKEKEIRRKKAKAVQKEMPTSNSKPIIQSELNASVPKLGKEQKRNLSSSRDKKRKNFWNLLLTLNL